MSGDKRHSSIAQADVTELVLIPDNSVFIRSVRYCSRPTTLTMFCRKRQGESVKTQNYVNKLNNHGKTA